MLVQSLPLGTRSTIQGVVLLVTSVAAIKWDIVKRFLCTPPVNAIVIPSYDVEM